MTETLEQMRGRHEKELEQQVKSHLNVMRAMTERHRRELVEVVMRSQPADFVQELCRQLRQPMIEIMRDEVPSSVEHSDAQAVISIIDRLESKLTK